MWYGDGDDKWPGYFTSKDGPTSSPESLKVTQSRITAISRLTPPFDFSFYDEDGAKSTEDDTLFAKLVRGDSEVEQWRVWESPTHVAWLTPFGNTRGFTVLVPRTHLSSDVFGGLGDGEYEGLMRATWEVMGILRRAFARSGDKEDGEKEKRVTVGIFFEGYEVDYTHVKLLPAVVGDGMGMGEEEPERGEYYEKYPGFVTTQKGPEVVDQEGLVKLADELRRALDGKL